MTRLDFDRNGKRLCCGGTGPDFVIAAALAQKAATVRLEDLANGLPLVVHAAAKIGRAHV